MEEYFNKIKQTVIKVCKRILIKILVPVLILISLLGASIYYLTLDDAVARTNDMSNVPYAVSQYKNGVNIGNDGQLVSSTTAQELWDEMKKNGSRVNQYLDTPEELLKLMNAELVTQYLDTRKNPDEDINWDSDVLNDINSNSIQGIVKLKRQGVDKKNTTMTYVDSETFQRYIDNYNSSGSEADKEKALSHFTLESVTSSSSSDQNQSPITAGETIKIPTGLGSVHTYMGWQKITSVSSTQYVLRDKAGMNFDEEGFGKINNRYVIACTTTFGNVGDYVDFYQEDGTIIPCIIGDVKNQNDSGCNKWGHEDGHCIIEFVVDTETWYYPTYHTNPGTSRISSRMESKFNKSCKWWKLF